MSLDLDSNIEDINDLNEELFEKEDKSKKQENLDINAIMNGAEEDTIFEDDVKSVKEILDSTEVPDVSFDDDDLETLRQKREQLLNMNNKGKNI